MTDTATHEGAAQPMRGLFPAVFNGVVMQLTLRAAMSRRRALLFALPAVLLIGISALLKATADSAVWPPEVLGTIGYLILALTALIVGGSVLGAEVDDGSILHLLATPVSRRAIVLSKYLIAVVLTMAFAVVPEYLAGAIATGASSRLAIGLLIGALAGSVIYNAIFLMLTAILSPGAALAVGLLYILLWEGLLASLVPGVGLLSAEHYSLAIANSVAHNGALHANLTLGTGTGMGIAITALCLVLATMSLAGFNVKGDVA
ncbi:MAG: ABC transporter permease [Streptosporangiaceae bacterium]